MSYTALYRKFRPNVFAGIVGQEHIVKTLKNQMKTGHVSHAYLFCGTRGTGKTSTAKIFARAINCLHPTEDGEPCNTCQVCQDILAGRSVNVIEIDAASNNGVENIREIREEVQYAPTEGIYKVYIIDEVHMLSNSAFNALLKTLEEPPAHVIFILATTDPQKVPATILSRCQRFDFRRISTEDITHTLLQYLQEEGYRAEDDAVQYVAQLADGSLRDSLSILDQCIAFYSNEEITLSKVQDIMGAVDQSVFFDMTDALAHRDAQHAMMLIEQIITNGRDIKQFLTELLSHLRNLLVAATVADAGKILDLSAENALRLQTQANTISAAELSCLIRAFSALQQEMRYAANARLLLEVEVLRLCSEWTGSDVETLVARLSELERKVAEGVQVTVTTTAQSQTTEAPPKPKKKKKQPIIPEDYKKLQSQWQTICAQTDNVILRSELQQVEIGFRDDTILLICAYGALSDMLEKHTERIQLLLENAIGKEVTFQIIDKAAYLQSGENALLTEEDEEAEEPMDPEMESLLKGYFPEADVEP